MVATEKRARFHSVLGFVGCSLVSALAFAQEPAPAEPAPAEPLPAEPPPADPAAPAEAADPNAPADPAAGDLEVDSLDPGDLEVGGAAGDDRLDEVVVTVDRRKKDLQDYSGVAAAFTETKLASVGITNAREMAALVPGLQIGVQEGNTEVFIRGVGSDNNTELGDPAVSLHVDGVYIPRPRGVGSMFFDIERVEVNSGPQGTVRGRNAMGGAVNIVSKRPKLEEFGADAEATFGTFAQRRYQGMVNIPLGSHVAFRAAAFSEVHDPYWENAGPLYDIRPAEDADSWAVRAQLLYQPTQRFYMLLGYDYTYEGGTGYLGANFQGPLSAADRSDPLAPMGIPFAIDELDNPRRVYYRGMHPSVDMWHEGYRAEVNFDTGPVILQALGSYRRLQYEQWNGANAGAVVPGYNFAGAPCGAASAPAGGACLQDTYTNGFWDSRSQSFIGELRAFAPDDSRLRWTAGAFYFNEDQQVFLGQVSDPATNFGGGEFNMPDVKGSSIAGYVDATFDVVESFRVIGGARLTHENKSRKNGLWALWQNFPGSGTNRYGTPGFQYEGLDRSNYAPDPGPDGVLSIEERVNFFLDGVESFGSRDTLPQSLCNDPPAPEMGQPQQPRVVPNPDPNGSGMRCNYGVRQFLNPNIVNWVPQDNDNTANYFDWRAGVEYDLAKDNLLYFTVTTGHKAGGFNDTAPGAMPDELYNSDYKPERVLAFELGSKNTFFQKNLRVNGSAFFYRYNDMVFQTIAGVGGPAEEMMDENMMQAAPNTAVRQNAPSATPIYGLDLDVTYRLPLGLEAEAHLLLMDAKFADDTIVKDTRISTDPNQNYNVDIGGHWLPRVSAATLNFALSQLIYTGAGSFNWVVQGQTRTKHYMSVYNGDGQALDPAEEQEANWVQTAYNLLQFPGMAQRLTDVVPAYTRFDVGAGWTHPDGRISVNGFINNLTNIAYSTSIIANADLNLRFFNPPRTAGVRMKVEW